MWLKWKNWNDQLALVLLVGIPMLWVYAKLPSEAMGATIVMWTLTIQYYFRRAPTDPPASGA